MHTIALQSLYVGGKLEKKRKTEWYNIVRSTFNRIIGDSLVTSLLMANSSKFLLRRRGTLGR